MDYVIQEITSIVKKGCFGSVNLISTAVNDRSDKGAQFASTICFLDILVTDGKSEKSYPVVIKLQIEDEAERELLLGAECFQNEVIAYRDLLPIMNASDLDLFPKMHYGNFTGGKDFKKDLIILQDLSDQGFELPKSKIFLDYFHIVPALEKLGQFHALSHIARKENPKEFYSYCSQLSKSKFENESNEDLQAICEVTLRRGIQRVIEKGADSDLLKRLLDECKSVRNIVRKIFEPEEPFAVLCHGDFNRNNVFYKYNDCGKPVDIRFFDLQNVRYTTPVVDLSFMLYMNTTQEDRDKFWDDYLNVYWSGFTSIMPNPSFTFKEFYEHFSKRAFYGYLPCSFFLPCMLEENPTPLGEMQLMTFEEKRNLLLSNGGEGGTVCISEIVQHMLDKKYIQSYFKLS